MSSSIRHGNALDGSLILTSLKTIQGQALGSNLVGGQPSPGNFQYNLESPLDGLLTAEVLHDVFGWGVGAGEWQTQDPLMCDMLDFGNLEMNLALGVARSASNQAGDVYPNTGLQRFDPQQVAWADQRIEESSNATNTYPAGTTQYVNGNSSPGQARQDDETAWVRTRQGISEEIEVLMSCIS